MQKALLNSMNFGTLLDVSRAWNIREYVLVTHLCVGDYLAELEASSKSMRTRLRGARITTRVQWFAAWVIVTSAPSRCLQLSSLFLSAPPSNEDSCQVAPASAAKGKHTRTKSSQTCRQALNILGDFREDSIDVIIDNVGERTSVVSS